MHAPFELYIWGKKSRYCIFWIDWLACMQHLFLDPSVISSIFYQLLDSRCSYAINPRRVPSIKTLAADTWRTDVRYMVCGFMYICVVTFFVWFWYKCDHLISFGLYGYEYEQFNFLEIFLISFGLYVGTKTDWTPMVIYKYEYIYLSLLGFKFGYE